MCGRFENTADAAEIIKHLELYFPSFGLEPASHPRVNIKPTERIKTFMKKDDKIVLTTTKWGIKFNDNSPLIFNSRIETIKEKKFWKDSIRQHRSLVPMTAFYEWQPVFGSTRKQPLRITLKTDKIFYIPAISIKINGSDEYYTSLITCPPNEFMNSIHDRMPVIHIKNSMKGYFEDDTELMLSHCVPLNNMITMAAEPVTL